MSFKFEKRDVRPELMAKLGYSYAGMLGAGAHGFVLKYENMETRQYVAVKFIASASVFVRESSNYKTIASQFPELLPFVVNVVDIVPYPKNSELEDIIGLDTASFVKKAIGYGEISDQSDFMRVDKYPSNGGLIIMDLMYNNLDNTKFRLIDILQHREFSLQWYDFMKKARAACVRSRFFHNDLFLKNILYKFVFEEFGSHIKKISFKIGDLSMSRFPEPGMSKTDIHMLDSYIDEEWNVLLEITKKVEERMISTELDRLEVKDVSVPKISKVYDIFNRSQY